jgi:hypothetical protein
MGIPQENARREGLDPESDGRASYSVTFVVEIWKTFIEAFKNDRVTGSA